MLLVLYCFVFVFFFVLFWLFVWFLFVCSGFVLCIYVFCIDLFIYFIYFSHFILFCLRVKFCMYRSCMWIENHFIIIFIILTSEFIIVSREKLLGIHSSQPPDLLGMQINMTTNQFGQTPIRPQNLFVRLITTIFDKISWNRIWKSHICNAVMLVILMHWNSPSWVCKADAFRNA